MEDLNRRAGRDTPKEEEKEPYSGRWLLQVTDPKHKVIFENEFVDRNRATPPEKQYNPIPRTATMDPLPR